MLATDFAPARGNSLAVSGVTEFTLAAWAKCGAFYSLFQAVMENVATRFATGHVARQEQLICKGKDTCSVIVC
ncbi:hypothetical protein GPA19_14945 [Azoarcus indigens]|uniref:hypothetical protein n=1 Tax=Azoarcus indigens TaxID=29545 RepID=UPI0010603FB0|nr:hypothetical protein [Azoarcus indigens]NMG66240.1 hypothetical protein [Azoarcus indigens]